MIMDGLYTFGGVNLPNPNMLSKPTEILIAFIIGLTLFVIPISTMETILKNWLTKKSNEL